MTASVSTYQTRPSTTQKAGRLARNYPPLMRVEGSSFKTDPNYAQHWHHISAINRGKRDLELAQKKVEEQKKEKVGASDFQKLLKVKQEIYREIN